MTPTYRWIQFAKCEACGVDAGERCMTLNNEKAEHPCIGRVRRISRRINGVCPKGHRVVGGNVIVKGHYEECRECHNASCAASRRRAREKEKASNADHR